MDKKKQAGLMLRFREEIFLAMFDYFPTRGWSLKLGSNASFIAASVSFGVVDVYLAIAETSMADEFDPILARVQHLEFSAEIFGRLCRPNGQLATDEYRDFYIQVHPYLNSKNSDEARKETVEIGRNLALSLRVHLENPFDCDSDRACSLAFERLAEFFMRQ